MSRKAAALPVFESPPVIEVVIGVSFNQLKHLTTSHFGLFWQQIKRNYPFFEDHPPLADPTLPLGQLQFAALDKPPLRRVFFRASDRDYLLQLQPDRFVHNWRKTDDVAPYPHFPAAKSKFNAAWTEFQRFVAKLELGPIQVVQFEVTYINHFVEEPGNFPGKTGFYTPLFNGENTGSTGYLPSPSALAYNLQFPFPEGQGTLYVSSKHGTRGSDKKDVMIFELSARGPIREDGASLDTYFELGHEWIVRGFKDLTSREAHQQWKIIK